MTLGPNAVLCRPRDEDQLRRDFLYYYLISEPGQQSLRTILSGSAQPKFNKTDLRTLSVPVPPLSEQRAIAHILGTLDDKIELNRRMSETLEAMARALFKSWFVDFDPVRAKAEGRDPGLPQPLADLFPDSFEDSELGEIPRGWGVAQLDDLAAIQGGKQLPTADCQPTGMFPVFGANGIMGYASRTTHDGFVIAFGRVGAYCGSVHWTYAGAWINNNASSVVPKGWPEFVLQTMLEADFEGMRTGSAQPFIPNTSLAALQVIRAPDNVLNEFCAIVHSLRLKEQASHRQSHTLAALRDTLLPKLISGELRVKDAEEFIGENM
jgi:type I restriction enzyme S subunit